MIHYEICSLQSSFFRFQFHFAFDIDFRHTDVFRSIDRGDMSRMKHLQMFITKYIVSFKVVATSYWLTFLRLWEKSQRTNYYKLMQRD